MVRQCSTLIDIAAILGQKEILCRGNALLLRPLWQYCDRRQYEVQVYTEFIVIISKILKIMTLIRPRYLYAIRNVSMQINCQGN